MPVSAPLAEDLAHELPEYALAEVRRIEEPAGLTREDERLVPSDIGLEFRQHIPEPR